MPPYLFTILACSLLVYTLLLIYLMVGLSRVRSPGMRHTPAISVVIAARNEAPNITACLQAVLGQSYPRQRVEIIVVDDRSTDGTSAVLRTFQEKDSRLQIIHITEKPAAGSGKRTALSRGISAATGDLIFTTDADCVPPPGWLHGMVRYFSEETGVVIGAAPFFDCGNIWTRVLMLDNMARAFVAAGASGWNVGLTCTGRNLAYRKSVYEQVNGFEAFAESVSGDDDLFVQTVTRNTNWRINFSTGADTAVPSLAPPDFKTYVRQKQRHASAGKYYGPIQQGSYFLFHAANLILFATALSGLVVPSFRATTFLFFSTKLLLDFIALYLITAKFGQRRLLRYFLTWEVFSVASELLIAPWGFISTIKWKE